VLNSVLDDASGTRPDSVATPRWIKPSKSTEDHDRFSIILHGDAVELDYARTGKTKAAQKIAARLGEAFPAQSQNPSARVVLNYLSESVADLKATVGGLVNERTAETGEMSLDGPLRSEVASTMQLFEQYTRDYQAECSSQRARTAQEAAEKKDIETSFLGTTRAVVEPILQAQKRARTRWEEIVSPEDEEEDPEGYANTLYNMTSDITAADAAAVPLPGVPAPTRAVRRRAPSATRNSHVRRPYRSEFKTATNMVLSKTAPDSLVEDLKEYYAMFVSGVRHVCHRLVHRSVKASILQPNIVHWVCHFGTCSGRKS